MYGKEGKPPPFQLITGSSYAATSQVCTSEDETEMELHTIATYTRAAGAVKITLLKLIGNRPPTTPPSDSSGHVFK